MPRCLVIRYGFVVCSLNKKYKQNIDLVYNLDYELQWKLFNLNIWDRYYDYLVGNSTISRFNKCNFLLNYWWMTNTMTPEIEAGPGVIFILTRPGLTWVGNPCCQMDSQDLTISRERFAIVRPWSNLRGNYIHFLMFNWYTSFYVLATAQPP
jgi:hypothetical protein